jgi:sensor histidine kinase regulating citrate/malate metabolism
MVWGSNTFLKTKERDAPFDSVVKRIIDRHGGRVRVGSTPGEGTTFVFTLPAA